MPQDQARLQGAIAVTRFGMGARPGEIDAVAVDPKAWLRAQARPERVPRPTGEFPSGAEGVAAVSEYREAAQQMRRARTAPPAATMAPATGMAPTAGMEEEDDGIPEAVRQAGRALRLRAGQEYLASFQLATSTPDGFAERWVRFWWNHFAIAVNKLVVAPLAGSYERDAIRANAFGRFDDLLVAAESHPAMLVYLDQAQSIGPSSLAGQRRRAAGLNENLAREILELHTVGADAGYSQADVTEFARALTGWSVRMTNLPQRLYTGAVDGPHGFTWVPAIHEPGVRQVMGRSYPQRGGDQTLAILADLAAHPATGRKVARQLAVHFHSDTPPASLVERLETAWTDGGRRLDLLALALIDAPEMWEPEARKFKRPEEFLVSSYRVLGLTPPRIEPVQRTLTALGQQAWYPPSPEGWPDEAAAWTAPDAIIKRLTWAQRFSEATVRDQSPVGLAESALGLRLTEKTRSAVRRAEDRAEAVAILLMSPEFQRR
jgi:uncharacterized protein (DUF1800 family)